MEWICAQRAVGRAGSYIWVPPPGTGGLQGQA